MREELVKAVEEEDLETVRGLLASGADPAVESEPGGGDSAIHAAANAGKIALLEPLIAAWLERAPAAIKASDILWSVLFNRQNEAGRLLADHGAEKRFPMAVALGDLDDAEKWFDSDGRLPDERGKPLSEEVQTCEFNCAFFYAAICGSVEGLNYALRGIADINMQPPGEDFGGVSATPLHWAAGHGRPGAVGWLLKQGADAAIRDDAWNATPVGWAQQAGCVDVLDVFRQFPDRLDKTDLENLSLR